MNLKFAKYYLVHALINTVELNSGHCIRTSHNKMRQIREMTIQEKKLAGLCEPTVELKFLYVGSKEIDIGLNC